MKRLSSAAFLAMAIFDADTTNRSLSMLMPTTRTPKHILVCGCIFRNLFFASSQKSPHSLEQLHWPMCEGKVDVKKATVDTRQGWRRWKETEFLPEENFLDILSAPDKTGSSTCIPDSQVPAFLPLIRSSEVVWARRGSRSYLGPSFVDFRAKKVPEVLFIRRSLIQHWHQKCSISRPQKLAKKCAQKKFSSSFIREGW